MIYGRRKFARSWKAILRSEEARQRGFTGGITSKVSDTLLRAVRQDGVIEIHVDDGHGCEMKTIVTFVNEKIEMKYVQGIWWQL